MDISPKGVKLMLRESIKMSWQNIVHNKMRSFLTILGIVIGVTAIIALITIVQGVINEVNTQFETLGSNTLSVQAMGTPLKTGLSENDLEKLSNVEGISGISPSVSTKLNIGYSNQTKKDVLIEGKNEVYFKRDSEMIQNGRGLTLLDVQNKNNVCVMGKDLANSLFVGKSAIGEKILLDGISYTVVGTAKQSSSLSGMNSSKAESIIIPYKNMLKLVGTNSVMSLEMYMSDSNNSEQVTNSIEVVLNQAFNYKDDSYSILNMESLLDVMRDMQNMMQLMLVGIASIALLVGGIGIMNMMLVSVTERTTEIGLRKALGAEPKRIQMQFLTEAIFLSLFGGIVGIALGLIISIVASIAIDIPFTVSFFAIGLGVGFSAAVGIIFGLAPARKASRLNPIDALRSV
jgi:putative ABC transport system permease protein